MGAIDIPFLFFAAVVPSTPCQNNNNKVIAMENNIGHPGEDPGFSEGGGGG